MSEDNPFETKGMTLDTFNKLVPMGAWYLDQHGKPRQRTVPPPSEQQSSAPAGAPSAQQVAYDDQEAMTDAA